MIVLYPYTAKHSETIDSAPANALWAYVGDDNHAYWRTLVYYWREAADHGNDLMIVEHDVAIHDNVIPHFAKCDKLWCGYGYDNMCHPECQEAWNNQLGCVRFRAELIQAVPDAVLDSEIRDWHNLCDGIGRNLRAEGFTHHWHTPAVHHHRMKLEIAELI